MAEPPSSDQVQKRIHAALLDVYPKKPAGLEMALCLREAYEVCANVFDYAREPLTDELLTKRIPAIVFDAAVEHRWIKYPLRRRSESGVISIVPIFKKPLPPLDEEIPQKELTETFGSHKVPAGFGAGFKARYLGSPIARWRAIMLERAAAVDSTDDGDTAARSLAAPLTQSGTGKSVNRKGADPVAAERIALLENFKATAREQGIKVTDLMVAKAAKPGKWNTRTMVTWWKRNDRKCEPPHDKLIRAVLTKNPATLWPKKA
jgi:hypothetical protein